MNFLKGDMNFCDRNELLYSEMAYIQTLIDMGYVPRHDAEFGCCLYKEAGPETLNPKVKHLVYDLCGAGYHYARNIFNRKTGRS